MLKTLRWRVAIPYIILIMLAMAGMALYFSGFVRELYLSDLRAQLLAESALVADALQLPLSRAATGEELVSSVAHFARLLNARVTIIRPDGTVLGDSLEDWRQMDNHSDRPEVAQALATGSGNSIRFSQTVGYEMMYATTLVMSEGHPAGIVRVALPLRQITARVTCLRMMVLLATLVMVAVALLLAVIIADRAARPVRRLREVVERVATGDLSARLFPTTRDEVGSLTRAFNQMTERLQSMMNTSEEERSRLAAILEHMGDGVLITDGEGRVRLINHAAARLLDVSDEKAVGSTFAQVVRDHRLIESLRRCAQQGVEQFEAVELDREGPFVQMVVTPLKDAGTSSCLVILQDLTRVRRLETVRRDFISSISHELRTPLASLKALVDTLRDGALEDPPAAQRFLDRMDAEVDSLVQMVQELLELSRIESGQVPLQLVPVAVAEVVLPSVERLRPPAERAGLELTVSLPTDIPPVLADAERTQQVVTNLVHNAIKFTPAGGLVAISASAGQDEVIISVKDTGIGIPAESLSRIFERFYKASRARSGQGTGLGLSIAKHIVQGHGGRIWAESVEGRGSTFRFSLPIAK